MTAAEVTAAAEVTTSARVAAAPVLRERAGRHDGRQSKRSKAHG
jgi:hypothetical protein